MPEKKTIERARRDAREGKAPSTRAGEFVREEIEHVREGKRGARSTKQAIAIGLSKARRAGGDLPAPRRGTSVRTRRQAARDRRRGQRGGAAGSMSRRSRAGRARGGARRRSAGPRSILQRGVPRAGPVGGPGLRLRA